MVVVMFYPPLLGGVHVPLEIDAHVRLGPGLVGLAAPDAVVVLLQAGNIGIARALDLRLRLSLGEAVAACDGCVGVVVIRAVDGVVARAALCLLGLRAYGH